MVLIAIIGKIVALFIRWPANHILNFVFVSIMGMFALYAVEVYTPYYSTQKLLSNLRVYVVALGVMIVGNNITGLVPWFAAQIMDFVLNKLASALALIVAAATSHSWVLSQKGYHTATRVISSTDVSLIHQNKRNMWINKKAEYTCCSKVLPYCLRFHLFLVARRNTQHSEI